MGLFYFQNNLRLKTKTRALLYHCSVKPFAGLQAVMCVKIKKTQTPFPANIRLSEARQISNLF